ncbi:MAG: hypothetical protein P8M30_16155 [Planctomycetaceae bacterium]|nr:hypothetical protein [Planctomycetaceae bacterium]MDG2390844.1 hypothetical protein [Planctomycetaceae bacterium]
MESTNLRRVEWRQLFPWLCLFGAFRIAIDPRKLILAVFGLCFVTGGNHAIDQIGLKSELIREAESVPQHLYPWDKSQASDGVGGIEPLSILTEPEGLREVFGRWNVLRDPLLNGVLHPVFVLTNSYDHGFSASVDALLRLLWFAFVWSIFGGAITRMAVQQFVKDEKLSMVAGVKFSCSKLVQFLSAPLLPLSGIFVLLCFCAGIGAAGRVPGVGPVIMSVLMGFALIFSVAIVIMLIGVGAGWPLMVAAISTEESDGFDGFSRAHSYIFDVPWHYLWCFVLAMIYASATVLFVEVMGLWVSQVAETGVSWGFGAEPLDGAESLVISIVGFWDSLWTALIIGYRASLFWVLFLLIYLVLRNASDRIPMNEASFVAISDGGNQEMALGGISAIKEDVEERPIGNPDEASNADSKSDSTPNPDAGDVSEEKPRG